VCPPRYAHLRLHVVHADEEDHLVVRSFHEELQQRVLVGGAQRGERSGARQPRLALEGDRLPEALRPELLEPERHRAESVRVRHHHVDGAALLGIGLVKERGEDPGRVARQFVGAAALVHGRGSREQLTRIDPAHRGRQESYG
jgi:hypothetical protein